MEVPVSGIRPVEEAQAAEPVRQTFDEIRRTMQVPAVPDLLRTLGIAPGVLSGTWGALRDVMLGTSLPMSLASMIMYSIASARDCRYCSAVHQATCRTVGVDEDSLAALAGDLEALAPRRVQTIVRFAMKAALEPKTLAEADYAAVRAEGVSEQELLEILGLAALANFLDTLADATRIDLDAGLAEAGTH